MKCEKCRYNIDVNDELKFIGEANVYGTTTLAKFNDEGIIWDRIGDSTEEEIKCPNCNEWVSPDMLEVRKEMASLCNTGDS